MLSSQKQLAATSPSTQIVAAQIIQRLANGLVIHRIDLLGLKFNIEQPRKLRNYTNKKQSLWRFEKALAGDKANLTKRVVEQSFLLELTSCETSGIEYFPRAYFIEL